MILLSKYFSADLHIGETPSPDNPSYYRGLPPVRFQRIFLEQCQKRIKPDDELYLVGDLVSKLADLSFYSRLPECKLYIICGNKEDYIPHFAEAAERMLLAHRGRLEVITGVYDVEINGQSWRVAHHPKQLLGYSVPKPSICGHVHNFWSVKKMPNGYPIVNVGVDAWGYALVSERTLEHVYQNVMSGLFDQYINFPQ